MSIFNSKEEKRLAVKLYPDLQDSLDMIKKHVDLRGGYSHNVISAALRGIANALNNKVADDIVIHFELDRLFSIYPEKETK